AGIYSTYMVPLTDDRAKMLRMLTDAIKGVYASVFYSDSKAYMTATSNLIDQEKMAVIIQEVVGQQIDDLYFPSFSGVGRSLNYYPLGNETAEDGVAEVAVGLGKYIVDGGLSLRFSPRHPAHALQTSELSLALRDTQTRMYALDMSNIESFKVDDGFNIVKKSVQDIAPSGALRFMTSVFDYRDNVLRDSDFGEGRRVVTFNNILKHDAYPLPMAIDFMLSTGQREMSRPIEIEFAGMIEHGNPKSKGKIYWLQIRPIVERKDLVDEHLLQLPDESLILKSNTALGHGTIENVSTIVYIRPESFNSFSNPLTAREVEKINRDLTARGIPYILIGPGRWGSSDPSLGIPVKWPQIANARLIVESSVGNYRIEPSQGTHFFQNLTSFGVGYFTIDADADNGFFNVDYLNSRDAVYESDTIRIVEFESPLAIGIDGRKGRGVVALPDATATSPESESGN
nr:PEP/pyruvate-binding domain-containing protein [Paramuribaculum sp.]